LSFHCISAAPASLDRYLRGCTDHVARPSRSIQSKIDRIHFMRSKVFTEKVGSRKAKVEDATETSFHSVERFLGDGKGYPLIATGLLGKNDFQSPDTITFPR